MLRKIRWDIAWWWRYRLRDEAAKLGFTPKPPDEHYRGEYPQALYERLEYSMRPDPDPYLEALVDALVEDK